MARNVKNEDFSNEHTDLLRIFGKLHDLAGKTNPRNNTTISPDNEQPLLLSQTISATGGSRELMRRADWLALVRVWKLTPRRFSRS